MLSLFADFIEQFRRTSQGNVSQDVHAVNPSFSSPTVVPDIGTLEMGPSGGATSHTGPMAVPGSAQPSGVVQPYMQEIPARIASTFPSLALPGSDVLVPSVLPSPAILGAVRSIGHLGYPSSLDSSRSDFFS